MNLVVLFLFLSFLTLICFSIFKLINIFSERNYDKLLKINNSIKNSILITALLIFLEVSLFFLIDKYNLRFISSKTNMVTSLSLIFTILAVYSIIFSLAQMTISNSSNRKMYWGYYIDERPYKMVILESWVQSTVFKMNILFFVIAPFLMKIIKRPVIIDLWHVSLFLILITTVINIIWGYDSMRLVNSLNFEDIKTDYRQVISNAVSNRYIGYLKDDLFWRSPRMLKSQLTRTINLMEMDEVNNFLMFVWRRINFETQRVLISNNRKYFSMLSSKRKKKRIQRNAIWLYTNDFWNLIQELEYPTSRIDNRTLEQLYLSSIRLFELLCEDTVFFRNHLWENEVCHLESEGRRYEINNNSILFPQTILKRRTNDIEYWIEINQIIQNNIPKILESMEIDPKSILFTDKYYYFFRINSEDEKTIENILSNEFYSLMHHELDEVKFVNEDSDQYIYFVSTLLHLFKPYSVDFLIHFVNNSTKLSIDQRNLIKEELDHYNHPPKGPTSFGFNRY